MAPGAVARPFRRTSGHRDRIQGKQGYAQGRWAQPGDRHRTPTRNRASKRYHLDRDDHDLSNPAPTGRRRSLDRTPAGPDVRAGPHGAHGLSAARRPGAAAGTLLRRRRRPRPHVGLAAFLAHYDRPRAGHSVRPLGRGTGLAGPGRRARFGGPRPARGRPSRPPHLCRGGRARVLPALRLHQRALARPPLAGAGRPAPFPGGRTRSGRARRD
jgi:hypothetical protein